MYNFYLHLKPINVGGCYQESIHLQKCRVHNNKEKSPTVMILCKNGALRARLILQNFFLKVIFSAILCI